MLAVLRRTDRLFYGWVVVTAFIVITVILYGINYSFGFFFKALAGEFNLTRTVTSAVVSTELVLAGMAALGAGWLLDKYGPKKVIIVMGLFAGLSLLLTSQISAPWQLFFTYGVLLSLGVGAVYTLPTSVVCRWFDKKRGLAAGIVGSSSGLGAIAAAPLVSYLIASFDWRMAYIIIGLAAWAIIIPFALLLKGDPREVGALPDGMKFDSEANKSDGEDIYHISHIEYSFLHVVRTRSFWFIMLIWMFFGSSLFLIVTHLVPNITDRGFTTAEAAGVISTMGVAAIVGRVLMGLAADRIGRKLIAIIAALLQAGAMLWLVWSQELWMFYLFALVYGFGYSGLGSSMGAFIGDVFGLARIGSIFGALEIGFGIGAATGPIIGGLVFDNAGSYSLAFLIAAFGLLLAALLIGLVRKEINNHCKRRLA